MPAGGSAPYLGTGDGANYAAAPVYAPAGSLATSDDELATPRAGMSAVNASDRINEAGNGGGGDGGGAGGGAR